MAADERTRTFGDLMADGTYRSRDEIQNLHMALIDALFRGRGWGELHDYAGPDGNGELPTDKMEAITQELQSLLVMYGLRAEEAQLDQAEAQAEAGMDVSNGYGVLSKRPFVEVHAVGQLRPEMARALALWLLDAAAVAEDDAMVLRWVEEKLEVDGDAAARMMDDMRKYREDLRRADYQEGTEAAPLQQLRRAGVRRIG